MESRCGILCSKCDWKKLKNARVVLILVIRSGEFVR